jgi:hypothetical protein
MPNAIRPEALRIQAILAAQRTAVKGNKRSDALSVSNQSMAANTD